eukprot:TRINITY_DN14199_c0_g1_i1.p1 TRINITY_DN14199_c0_g1~~TRINITY_DN14199_c0_g1_i1.p1  ORF type:complete len:193 (+),score=25.66 TRINITY_DN14199_c0_g1_i1:123-701(+)
MMKEVLLMIVGVAMTIAVTLAPTNSAIIPFTGYPTFKQCNSSWGSNVMVNQTICEVGCLMSSVSESLNGKGILLPGGIAANPGTLNKWLQGNGGYDSGDDLEEAVVPKISPGRIRWSGKYLGGNSLSYATISDWLGLERIVIGNVDKGHHFVLIVGYDSTDNDTLYIHDSGFDRTTYSYSRDLVGYRIFDMQ